MASRIRWSFVAGLIYVGVACAGAAAQPAGKKLPVRTGVMTTEPMVVVFVESAARLDDLERQVQAAMMKLLQDAAQAGLTVIPQAIVRMDMPQGMEGATIVAWEAQIPVANEGPKEGPRDFGQFKLKTVEPMRVAYTFHQGNLEGVEFTIQMLVGWMMQNGQAPGNKLTFVLRSDPTKAGTAEMVLEVRIDTKAG